MADQWYIMNEKGKLLSIQNRKIRWVGMKYHNKAKGFAFKEEAIAYAENRNIEYADVRMPYPVL